MRFGDDDGIEVEALEPPDASGGQLIETGGPGRFRTIALVVAGVALLGGVVAFAGRDSSTSDERSSDTRPTATTRDRSATSTTLDDGRPTTTTLPPTTTTLPSVIGPLLDEPSGLRIVVADDKNRVTRIDLDTGTVDVINDRARDVYRVVASGEYLYWEGERGARWVDPDGLEVDTARAGFGGQPIDSDGSTFWEQGYSNSTNASTITQLDAPAGEPIAPPVDLPQNSYVVGVAAGRPIVWVNGGGTYALGVEGAPPARLGLGVPSALGGGAVMLDECDEQIRCRAVLVDVVSGERSDVADLIGGSRGFYGGENARISPDRRYFAGIDFDGNLITVNDLRSGNEVLSRSYRYPESGPGVLRWSKDGKWLVWQSGQSIFVWNVLEPRGDPTLLKLPVEVRSFDLIDHA
ncbi:MAG: hypothetical protein AB7V43_22675 [Acidimicrobiia bacterium]